MGYCKSKIVAATVAALLVAAGAAWAADEVVKLPAPDTKGGRPLMAALKARHSTREFSPRALSDQVLSNLLWAAFGVNRPDGRRTAPSAVNWQEIDIYVVKADGVYVFDARAHVLRQVLAEDVRGEIGRQPFVKAAPVTLVYVADFARMKRGDDESKKIYSAADTGFIGQNVYLFAASEGMSTVIIGSVNKEALAKKLSLRAEQKIILAQPVGYPAGSEDAPKKQDG